jgi:thiol-disulfide isomerase/thioredoxin
MHAMFLFFLCFAAEPEKPAVAEKADKPVSPRDLYYKLREQEQKALQARRGLGFKPVHKEFIGKFQAHADKYPDDSSAFDALVYIWSEGDRVDSKAAKKALERIRKDYLRTPLVRPGMINLGLSQDSRKWDLLKEIGETNDSKLIRALAWRTIIQEVEIPNFPPEIANQELTKKQLDKKRAVRDLAKDKLRAAELAGDIPDLSIGKKAPATVAIDLAGKKVDLANMKGKVIVLDFWTTNCGPCVRMIPHTNKLMTEMKGRPFTSISVSADETKEVVIAFRKKTEYLGEHWWMDYYSELRDVWNVRAWPTIYVIDHEGVIRHSQVGFDAKSDKIAEIVRELVQKAERAKK